MKTRMVELLNVTNTLSELSIRLAESFYEDNQIYRAQIRIQKKRDEIQKERDAIMKLRQVAHRRNELEKIRKQNEKEREARCKKDGR